MAKKKSSKPIEAEVVSEEIKEGVIEVTDSVTEEISEEITDAMVEEVVEVAEAPKDDEKNNQFVYAQLKAINKLSNPAKAKRLADRVLRNRKR